MGGRGPGRRSDMEAVGEPGAFVRQHCMERPARRGAKTMPHRTAPGGRRGKIMPPALPADDDQSDGRGRLRVVARQGGRSPYNSIDAFPRESAEI